MAEHILKTWPREFHAVRSVAKPFEYRKADRDFRVGDILILREYDPGGFGEAVEPGFYTGAVERREVTYVLSEGFGLPEGYVVLGLKDTESTPAPVSHDLADRLAGLKLNSCTCDGLRGKGEHDPGCPTDVIHDACVALRACTPAPVPHMRVKAEAFDQIVAARKAYVEASSAYNARLEIVRAERERGNWSMKVDAEFVAMTNRQHDWFRIVRELADAALAAEGRE